MRYCGVARATFASGAMLAFSFACAADGKEEVDEQEAPLRPKLAQEFSAGGIVRTARRDPGLIGGGNGGTGTSVNYDDGDLNYGRGFTSLALQGRSIITGASQHAEYALEAVYFYDFLNAGGDTEFRHLSDTARDRVGRDIYLNDAYVGAKQDLDDAQLRVRVGNQRLNWGESTSFGQAMTPVNPVALSRRYQPGNTAKDYVIALPMLSAQLVTAGKWTLSGFYLFDFKPSEPEALGSLLSPNDFYSPGATYLQLGRGSPLVPDEDASVTTAATPFGSLVPRGADRMPRDSGQFGLRAETPELGDAKVVLSGYAMRVHSRESLVSVHTGTLGGLLGTTAKDYTSSGYYFLEYPEDVPMVGASMRLKPAPYTQLGVNYGLRIHQPLQIDDDILLTAGLAPAAAVSACSPNPASARCAATLASLNRNPIVSAHGGISAANAAQFFDTELSGYERFEVSQWSLSAAQGLPPMLGASKWLATAEVGGVYIHGFRPDYIDANVTVRPDDNGARRNGIATRYAWGYRLSTRIEFPDVAGMKSIAPSLTWIHDVEGNAPNPIGLFLEGTRSYIVAADATFDKSLSARIAYRSWLGRGNDADRYTDRDFVMFSLTWKF